MTARSDAGESLELVVTGMTCGGCRRHVEGALAGVEGVESVAVDLAAGRATVSFAAGAVSAAGLVRAVEEAGYGAAPAGADASGAGSGPELGPPACH